jgi:SAM-dependent methyltransferase
MSALGDFTRVRLVHACEQRELSVVELCQGLQLPQSTASRHLKVLSEDGWLGVRRDGTSRYYRVNRERLPPAARQLWKWIRSQFAEESTLREDEARIERVVSARQSRSQEFFASSSGHWDRLRGELFGNFEATSFLALLDPAARVGDLGCGTGRTAELLAGFVGEVVAVDASAEMIKAARARLRPLHNVTLHRASLEELPLGDETLDAAFVKLVLHHVADPSAAIAEVARVLAPGGKLVIVDMQGHEREEYRLEMGHVWLGFSNTELQDWLGGAGLTDVRYVPLPPEPGAKGPPLFVATARRPLANEAHGSQTRGHDARGQRGRRAA